MILVSIIRFVALLSAGLLAGIFPGDRVGLGFAYFFFRSASADSACSLCSVHASFTDCRCAERASMVISAPCQRRNSAIPSACLGRGRSLDRIRADHGD